MVRNPYDKMVSSYNMARNRDNYPGTFADFVKSRSCYSHPRYCIDGKPSMDHYIRFENLEEDLKTVCRKLNLECNMKELPRFKTTFRKTGDSYQNYYTEELRKIVYSKHQKEFDRFGYSEKIKERCTVS